MSVLIKIYASFTLADPDILAAVQLAARDAISLETATGSNHAQPAWVELDDTRIAIAFEGIYFPTEEVIAVLAATLAQDAEGKLDQLDIEAWTLTRYNWQNGTFHSSTRSLNHVLAHSGH